MRTADLPTATSAVDQMDAYLDQIAALLSEIRALAAQLKGDASGRPEDRSRPVGGPTL